MSVEVTYDEMRAKHHDHLGDLFDPIATDRRGEICEGMALFMTIQPLNWHKGKLTVFYQGQYIDSAQRFDKALRLTKAHTGALDHFDHLANDPSFISECVWNEGMYNLSMTIPDFMTEPILWIGQIAKIAIAVFRLWLSLPGDRALPEFFNQLCVSIEFGGRGEIVIPDTRLHAPLD